jgi:ferredoxin
MASSEWRVRTSISLNCRPHRYSCTTCALWLTPGPMSRIWPRVGTAVPAARQAARSRLTVAVDEHVR